MTSEQISTLINLVAPLLIFLASWLAHRVYASLQPSHQQAVKSVADMVIPAIEQQYGDIGTNDQKRAQAVSAITEILNGLGVKGVNPVLIDTAIEAAVYAMKQQQLPAVTQPKLPIVRSEKGN